MRVDVRMMLRQPDPSWEFGRNREWIDITMIQDAWEVELDPRGDMGSESSYRHRPASVMGLQAAWRSGRPPDGPNAGPRKWKPRFYPHDERLEDPEDGALVIYGPHNSGADCGEPSFSIWMVPGTGHEAE